MKDRVDELALMNEHLIGGELDSLVADADNPLLNELIFGGADKRRLAYEIIEDLKDNHLIVIGDDAADGIGNAYVEPAHDALIMHWGTCQEWIEEFGEEQLLLKGRLWQAINDWQREAV